MLFKSFFINVREKRFGSRGTHKIKKNSSGSSGKLCFFIHSVIKLLNDRNILQDTTEEI